VFPCCSEPGLEIVHALIDQRGLEIVGGSSLPPSQDPSFSLLKHYITIPWLGSEEFHDVLATILRDHRIRLVFPATDGLIAELSRTDLGDVGLVAPRPDVADICLSKLKTYKRLEGVVPVPRIYEDDAQVEFPAYAKPLERAGMRGQMRVNDPEELRIARKSRRLVTEFLPGEEYEVNCLSDLQGDLMYANIRRLGRRVGGHILDSQGVEDDHMTAYVEAIAAELRIEGPWFAQFKRNREDHPVLLEVNGRIGGGSGLNRFAGVNLPLLAVKLFTGQSISKPIARRGVAVSRSLQFYVNTEPIDRVVWEMRSLIRTDGKVNPRAMACLFDLRNRSIPQYLLRPVGAEVGRLLKNAEIPALFENVVPYGGEEDASLLALCSLCVEPYQRNVCVTNGAGPLAQEIQKQLPGVLVATPDTLEMLGWERLS
jgi:hypothetical protein